MRASQVCGPPSVCQDTETLRRICPTCPISTTINPSPGPAQEQLTPSPFNSAWSWIDPTGQQALRSRELGPILRAYRHANGQSQEKLAERLGYGKTYISMIETGRRVVHDVASRRHIARVLAIPSHLLGVTDPEDTEFVAMLAFAESTIRLADVARTCGRAAEAVNELWPLVARLEARAAEGHLERATLTVLGKAWISLGVSLGTVLPDERGPALALLVRAAGSAGNPALYRETCRAAANLIERHQDNAILIDPFSWREIQMRALLDLHENAAAIRLAVQNTPTPTPAPQWDVIERITVADVLLTAGDRNSVEPILFAAINAASRHRLPHQIQRISRIAHRIGHRDLYEAARTSIRTACSHPILSSDNQAFTRGQS